MTGWCATFEYGSGVEWDGGGGYVDILRLDYYIYLGYY